MDLFNNPMVKSAKNALTPEQVEEYKKMGEYMYNNTNYAVAETAPIKDHASDQDLILYATEALKSGADPKDLSDPEIHALISVYGNEWYKRFGLELEDVRSMVPKLNRQQRRAIAKLQKKSKK